MSQNVENPNTIIRNTAGTELATATDPVRVDPTGTTVQPVSATALPLPTGAATAANQTTLGNQTTKINDGTNTVAIKAASTAPTASDPALVVAISPNTSISVENTSIGINGSAAPSSSTQIGGVDDAGDLQAAQVLATSPVGTENGVITRNIPSGTQAVSAASLPLPAGAATETSLAAQSLVDNAGFTDGASRVVPAGYVLDETAGTALTENDIAASRIDSKRAQVHVIEDASTRGQRLSVSASGAAKVDGSAVTQPISGTVTANIGTSGSLALDATLTGGTARTKVTDGTNNAAVKAASAAAIATDPALVVAISPNNSVAITAASLPLPTGAATSANQTTIGNQTTKINDGTTTVAVKAASTAPVATDPALVVAISPNSPVIVESGDKSNDSAAPGSNNLGVLPALANAAAPSWTEGNQVALSTDLAGSVRVDATSWLGSTAPTVGSKTSANSVPVVIASDQGAVAISAASLPLPVGAATSANQTTLGSQTTKINDGTTTAAVKAASTAAAATDPALVVAISPNNTIPVSAASLPLPTGAATETTLSSRLADATFTGRINTQGQKAMAASTPVVIASDQSAVPVSGAVTANVGTTNGLALDATLTGGTARTKITDGTTNVAVKAASTAAVATDPAVVVAISPNNSVAVTASSLPLPTGASTAANQTTLGSQTTKINDGTTTAVIKAASTAAVATDPAIVVAVSPNNTIPVSVASLPLPTGAATSANQTNGTQKTQVVDGSGNVLNSGDVASRAIFEKITDGTNTATVKAASTAAVATDTAIVVAISPNNPITSTPAADATSSGALNALNAAVTVTHPGLQSVGVFIAAGTLAGTVVAEQSYDGGTTWGGVYLRVIGTDLKTNSGVVFTNPNPDTFLSIVGGGGAGQTRVRVSAFTSGTAAATVRASDITDNNPLFSGAVGQSAPPSMAQIGGTDGSLAVAARMKNASTAAAATDPALVVAISPNNSVAITAASLPLPAGAATSANQTTLGNQTTKLNDGTTTVAVKAASTAAVATDPALVVAISPNNTVAISATSLPLPTGAATASNQTTLGSHTTKINDGTNTAAVKAASTAPVATDPSLVVTISPNSPAQSLAGNKTNNNAAPGATNLGVLPALANAASPSWTEGNQVVLSTLLNGNLRSDVSSWLGSTAPTVGSKTSANSVPVVIASDQGVVPVKQTSGTSAVTQVASSATSVTLISSNSSRRGVAIYNDSTKILYVKLGATASTTSYTKQLAKDEYWDVPFGYTGQIDGIWAAANGNAYVTELT